MRFWHLRLCYVFNFSVPIYLGYAKSTHTRAYKQLLSSGKNIMVNLMSAINFTNISRRSIYFLFLVSQANNQRLFCHQFYFYQMSFICWEFLYQTWNWNVAKQLRLRKKWKAARWANPLPKLWLGKPVHRLRLAGRCCGTHGCVVVLQLEAVTKTAKGKVARDALRTAREAQTCTPRDETTKHSAPHRTRTAGHDNTKLSRGNKMNGREWVGAGSAGTLQLA